ncbi:MAG: ATP-binding cassette domain-containing protein [Alistipes sp.]|nr:ATP-binding cassette domain-containing protein [Alistipes sp.]MBO7263788.1 ATP-binding cassette domain-containing protein [Alistipes sp.]
MDRITLKGVVPEIFASRDGISSDIWLREVSLERGKRYLVRAESGTGKSSLCSYIYGQRGDYRGTILFDNEDISRYDSNRWSGIRQKQISILFQELRLFGELTAFENVWIKNSITNFKSREEIFDLFEQLGIADKLDGRTDRLSYGQQQRVALIRALCQPFSFLLLDEPISHLDDKNSDVMRDVILREVVKQGAGMIATSIGKQMNIDYDLCLNL